MLPFLQEQWESAIGKVILDLVEQVSCLSGGMTPICTVLEKSLEKTMLSHFAGLNIGPSLNEFAYSTVKRIIVEHRFKTFFDLAAIYPDSHASFVEVRELMNGVDVDLSIMIEFCLGSLKSKLLQPHHSTESIIGQIINSLNAFKVIDPSGLVLDRCSRMARDYLNDNRGEEVPDAVLKLFCLLIEHAEPKVKIRFDDSNDAYSDYLTASYPSDWLPDPPAAGDTPIRNSSKSFETFTVLMNFSDKEAMFKRFHMEIAKRIMNGQNASDARILKFINLISNFIFEQAECSKWIVMLQDWQNSTQIFKQHSPYYRPLVISSAYWPQSPNLDQVEQNSFTDEYGFLSEIFKQAKPKRRVKWIIEQSSVDLDLKIAEIVFSLNGVPFYAYKAVEKLTRGGQLATVNIDEFSNREKEGLMFWAERGFLLYNTNGSLQLKAPSVGRPCDRNALHAALFDKKDIDAHNVSKKKAAIAPHIGAMVTAMLTNLGPMPAARIHGLLTTMSGLKDVGVEELSEWLSQHPEIASFDPLTGVFCRPIK